MLVIENFLSFKINDFLEIKNANGVAPSNAPPPVNLGNSSIIIFLANTVALSILKAFASIESSSELNSADIIRYCSSTGVAFGTPAAFSKRVVEGTANKFER